MYLCIVLYCGRKRYYYLRFMISNYFYIDIFIFYRAFIVYSTKILYKSKALKKKYDSS